MSSIADKTILIVGLGLIGGSIARALRKVHPQQTILAADTNPQTLKVALESGVVSGIVSGMASAAGKSLDECAQEADLIILAVPPLTIITVIGELAGHVGKNTVITDVGSVKSHILDTVNRQPDSFAANFVPGHPIAGSEKSGFAATYDDLFQGRKVILTPQPGTNPGAVALVNELWRSLGARVLAMSVARHDQVLAATSHLPHLLAFTVVDTLLAQEQSEDIFRYAAGGFADFSRLASSNPRMWTDIFLSNSEATLAVLEAYIDNLEKMKTLVANGDEQTMLTAFNRAKRSRDNFIVRHFDTGRQQQDMDHTTLRFNIQPGGNIRGDIRAPGDKSISHRAVILGSLAEGVTEVNGLLVGEDVLHTLAAFREMGVTIVGPEAGQIRLYGVGLHGLKAPREPLYMGNSGTAMRLLAGVLVGQDFNSELTGDESLSQRPMQRIAEPLQQMGAHIETGAGGRPPLKIQGSSLKGIRHVMKIASAQVKSCLLLAGMYADGETEVIEPAPTRDHSERMLQSFGYPVVRDETANVPGGKESPGSVRISAGHALRAGSIDIPADISSAAFFLVAASISPGADLTLRHVGVNPTRIGVLNLLTAMGANIELQNQTMVGGEPVADLRVRQAPLKGIQIPAEQIPLAIDEFPALFIAAACAEGETVLRGADELRVKESDRIEAMAIGLRTLGIEVETFADGLRIAGGSLEGGEIDSFGDHRIAMAFAVAGLRAQRPVSIVNCANVATSFPGFIDLAREVGLQISEHKA